MGNKKYKIISVIYVSLSLMISSCMILNNRCLIGDLTQYDLYVNDYLKLKPNEIINTFSDSEIERDTFYNKRFEFDECTYFYGRLRPDIVFQDHYRNIITSKRRDSTQLWLLWREFDKFENYDIDSIYVYHEVVIDSVLIGYYLKDSIVNPEIELSFKEFLKTEFNYNSTSDFPSNIYE